MKVVRVEFFPEALLEIEDAFEWYLEKSFQAAQAFSHEINAALELIASSPGSWPLFEAGTRRYILRKFPYAIVFHEVESGVEIVAVTHHRRRPRYWHCRVEPEA